MSPKTKRSSSLVRKEPLGLAAHEGLETLELPPAPVFIPACPGKQRWASVLPF